MLFLIKYGCDNPADRGKISMAQAGDKIVLIQNGVFWSLRDDLNQLLEKGIEVFAIEADLLARGYAVEDSKVPLISYDAFISLLEKTEKTLS